MNTGEACNWSRHAEESEDVVDAAHIDLGGHETGGKQCLDFGRKDQPIPLTRPVQRTDAKAIASDNEALFAIVPEGNSEGTP